MNINVINTDNLENNMTIVPDAEKPSGYMVYWKLAGTLSRATVCEALANAGVDAKHNPPDVGDTKSIKRALEAVRSRRSSTLVRKMGKTGGFSLVDERSDLLDLELIKDDSDQAYEVKVNASLNKHEDGSVSLRITPKDHPRADDIRREFEAQRGLLHCGTDLSQWLSVKIIPAVYGVNGRERGGFYLLHGEDSVNLFRKIAEALHAVSTFGSDKRLLNGAKLYMVPIVYSADLVDTVVDSLASEVEELAGALNEEATSNTLTLRGWEGKRKLVLAQESRISRFAEVLGDSFESLVTKLEEIRGVIGYQEARLDAAGDDDSAPNDVDVTAV